MKITDWEQVVPSNDPADAEETAQWEEIERLQAACPHPDGIDPEDGCLHCGFYAK